MSISEREPPGCPLPAVKVILTISRRSSWAMDFSSLMLGFLPLDKKASSALVPEVALPLCRVDVEAKSHSPFR